MTKYRKPKEPNPSIGIKITNSSVNIGDSTISGYDIPIEVNGIPIHIVGNIADKRVTVTTDGQILIEPNGN